MTSTKSIKFGLLTVSDTCFHAQKEDTAGPALKTRILESYPQATIIAQSMVPDDKDLISEKLRIWSRKTEIDCDIILTIGGTGFSPRDVTPEATKEVIDREASNLAFAMVSKSLAITDLAMLSRAVCGIRNKTIIINLPGSQKGATECFDFLKPILPHAVELLREDNESVAKTHHKVQHGEDNDSVTPSKVKINATANRPRSSPYPLLEVEEALKLIIEVSQPLISTEIIPIEKARNRVLAEEVISENPFPPFPASIKDGYAVKVEDGVGPRIVRDTSAAGDSPKKLPLRSGEAIRISTGAAVPEGADAVVQVENTTLLKATEDGSVELEINIDVAPTEGLDIRKVGSDIPKGSIVLRKGDRIDAPSIGVLATLGKSNVLVYRKPSAGILSTGNELVKHNEEVRPGQIRDSNKISLINLLEEHGFEASDCGIAKDNPDAVKASLYKAFKVNDIIITTGGVSMGEFDIVKNVLVEDFSATIHFARVNMKPGKPTTFASLILNGSRKIVFGLPGNPVSACVTCLLFVLPALRNLESNSICFHAVVKASVEGSQIKNNDIRPEYVRVKVRSTEEEGFIATSTGSQISSRLNSLMGANGLLYLPGKSETKRGEKYTVYIIGRL